MGTQRIVRFVLILTFVVGGMFYIRHKTSQQSVLRICTWSNYYPENILAEFSKKTGIKVELSYVSSNEELFAKLKAGATGFDIIQPSDYMVRQLSTLSMLSAMDHTQLPNIKHLDEYYTQLPYDPGLKVSVPFTWGTTGIAVNTEKVKVPEGGISWKFLFESVDPRHTSLLDDMREVFGGVLLSHSHSPNTRDAKTLLGVKTEISKIKDRVLLFSSEPKSLLLKEELTIAHIYSSDAVQAHFENPKIKYFIPKEGGTVWTDNFAIPKSSQKAKEAHLFIDYFLDPDNALQIIRQNHLATPNKTAKLRLPPDEISDPNIYPPIEELRKMQFLEDLGETLPVINQMWTELKS